MASRKKELSDDEKAIEEASNEEALSRLAGLDYVASATLGRFHESGAFVRGVRGPVGSGKSTAMCQEILRRAREQVPSRDGIRRTRFAIIRNTYGELKDTTLKSWLDWTPESVFGKFNRAQGEMRHHIQLSDIDCEVLFRALDKPDDVRKVLSLELTGVWVNEAREVPKQIIDALGDRVGRFPPMREGGATWSGVILDTNSPTKNHWWYKVAEELNPSGWEFFSQPAGLLHKDGKWIENPEAENTANLPKHYYSTRMAGKREDYIKVYYGNQYGFVLEGKPVFPEYADNVHGATGEMQIVPGRPVYIGIGLALESGALFGQRKENGQWIWLDELMPENGGAVSFADALSAKMAADFPSGTIFKIFTKKIDDPSDDDGEAVQILRGRRINAQPCRVNDATLRREAVAGPMSRLINGEPGLLISTKCKITREAMAGGYSYARMQISGEERYHDEPTNNRYQPLAEAAQYMHVGGGEAASVFRQPKATKLKYPEMGIV